MMRSHLTSVQLLFDQMDNQIMNSKLPLAFGQEFLLNRKPQSHAFSIDLGQSSEVTDQPQHPASQMYSTTLASIRGSYAQPSEKLGEMLSALQNIVNLNYTISKNRLGKVGANVEKASKMVTLNGEKITKLIEDFHILLTFDSVNKEKQVVKITSLIEAIVQTQCSLVGEKGINLTFESEIDTCASVHLSPQLLSFLLSQTIEKTAYSLPTGATINIILTPSPNESNLDIHLVYSCTHLTPPTNEPGSDGSLRNESNLLYQKYGIISELLQEYVDEINGNVSIHIRSDQLQQITLSLPIQSENEVPLIVDLSLREEQDSSSSIGQLSTVITSEAKSASLALLVGDNHDLYN